MALWMWARPTRMILRHTLRWPGRSLMTVIGIAFSVAVMISALQWVDSIDHLIDVHFFASQRQTVSVGLTETRSASVLKAFAGMPGVLAVEPERSLSVRFHSGHLNKRGSLAGRSLRAQLSR